MKRKNYYNLAGLALGAVFGYFAINFLAPKLEALFLSVAKKIKSKQSKEGEEDNIVDNNKDESGLNSFVEGFKESVEKVTAAGVEVE